jgi:hypothetical protein
MVPSAATLTVDRLIGQPVANNGKVSRDTLVRLFCPFSSGLMARKYEYERMRIS